MKFVVTRGRCGGIIVSGNDTSSRISGFKSLLVFSAAEWSKLITLNHSDCFFKIAQAKGANLGSFGSSFIFTHKPHTSRLLRYPFIKIVTRGDCLSSGFMYCFYDQFHFSTGISRLFHPLALS